MNDQIQFRLPGTTISAGHLPQEQDIQREFSENEMTQNNEVKFFFFFGFRIL